MFIPLFKKVPQLLRLTLQLGTEEGSNWHEKVKAFKPLDRVCNWEILKWFLIVRVRTEIQREAKFISHENQSRDLYKNIVKNKTLSSNSGSKCQECFNNNTKTKGKPLLSHLILNGQVTICSMSTHIFFQFPYYELHSQQHKII